MEWVAYGTRPIGERVARGRRVERACDSTRSLLSHGHPGNVLEVSTVAQAMRRGAPKVGEATKRPLNALVEASITRFRLVASLELMETWKPRPKVVGNVHRLALGEVGSQAVRRWQGDSERGSGFRRHGGTSMGDVPQAIVHIEPGTGSIRSPTRRRDVWPSQTMVRQVIRKKQAASTGAHDNDEREGIYLSCGD